MEKPTRALIVVRLSRLVEESTSAERQRADCERLCERKGWEVVGVAEDLNVSAGATSPFERPALREWIGDGAADPGRVGEFDVIVFWRLDRIVRSMVQLSDLVKWAQEHDVTMKSATEDHFDMTTTMGRTIAQLVASFAEIELEAIRERTGADQRHRIHTGKYRGSIAPWGYQPIYVEDRGWVLEQDPYQVRQIQLVVERLLSGESLRAIALHLNEAGELTPRDRNHQRRERPVQGYQWASGRLKELITSRTLLGQVVVRDEVPDVNGRPKRNNRGQKILGPERLVTNQDGTPLIRATPILDRETFERVLAEVRSREQTKSATVRSTALLVGIIYCGNCGSACYRMKGGPGRQPTYRCRSIQDGNPCGPPSATANLEHVDSQVEQQLLRLLGDSDRMVRVWDKGEDHASEIIELKGRLGELIPQLGTGPYKAGSEPHRLLSEQIDLTSQRLEELEAKGLRPAGWKWVPTGESFRDWWSGADPQEKNRYLKTMQVEVSFRHRLERKRGETPSVSVVFGDLPAMARQVSSNPALDMVTAALEAAPAGAVAEWKGGAWTTRAKTEVEANAETRR